MQKRIYSLATMLLIAYAQFAFAGSTGKITGKVTDAKTNEPIPFAAVTIAGTTMGAATDGEGRFVILNVPPGTYTVAAQVVGYQGVRKSNLGVSVDYTTTVDFSLKESAVELEAVEVRGERSPLIRQDQTNPVVAVSSDNIQMLPVTSISEVIGLQAGVVVSDDGAIHVRGGRSDEIAYTLNGMSLNNPYDNASSIGVATNAIQEVSVSTGTFSAEYGNALSGVVNYVTKEGGAKFNGSLRLLAGDYVSNHSDVFPNIQKIDPANNGRVEATVGGPLGLSDLTFYASGVFDRNRGHLYGTRTYTPEDFYVTRDELNWRTMVLDSTGQPYRDPNNSGNFVYINDPRLGSSNGPFYFNPLKNGMMVEQGLPTGDSATVPLNTSFAYNFQGNLTYKLSSTMKIKYELVFDKGQSQRAFYNSYRFNPNGRPTDFSSGIVHTIDWTHTISNNMFYTVKGSYNYSEAKTMTYLSENDPRYLPAFYQTLLPSTSFYTGGVDLGRITRSTESISGKFDLVAQLFNVHEVKFGLEYRSHTLKYENYDLQFVDANNPTKVITTFHDIYNDNLTIVPHVPDVLTGYTGYNRTPTQYAAYVQDKIELAKSLILNAGLRFEYFDPNAKYNTNLGNAVSANDTVFLTKDLVKAKAKQYLSPRVSIAYPISDQGTIRFSYGHFYQFGSLSSLYTNPAFRALSGSRPIFGNADVKPQRSIQYEIGLQQGLNPDLRLEVVGFYKDVRDYIFTQIVVTAKGDMSYEVLTNLDYANSRGITVSLYQRRAPGSLFSAAVDYTFAVAEGNRTAPREDFFFSEKSGKS
ncbi:MAG: TonB-dependent receptor, partial [Ignavibacteriales bacterium]|nr:TonB-dependent receptor [Ignavibacteriales bacterium]